MWGTVDLVFQKEKGGDFMISFFLAVNRPNRLPDRFPFTCCAAWLCKMVLQKRSFVNSVKKLYGYCAGEVPKWP